MATYDLIWTEDRPNVQFPPIGSVFYFGSGVSEFFKNNNEALRQPISVIFPTTVTDWGGIQYSIDSFAPQLAAGHFDVRFFGNQFPPAIGDQLDVSLTSDVIVPEYGINCRIRRGVITTL